MKKVLTISLATVAICAAAVPAHAGLLGMAELLKVASTVMKGKALLNKGATTCGSSLVVAPQENLLMDAASSAVQKLLPIAKYTSIASAATSSATTAAASPTFCATTAAAKPGILGSIASAAGKLGVGGKLGGLGSVLGGVTGSGATAPAAAPATGGLGKVLGGVFGQ